MPAPGADDDAVAGVTWFDDAGLRIELEQLADLAHGTIEANRGVSVGDAPDAEIGAALGRITQRLVQAGVDSRVAWETTTRWFVTRVEGGGRVPVLDCLRVELDPPYETGRVQADLGHRGTRKARRHAP
jgi:hypothetical protein